MKNREIDDQWLDALLAQPPELADQGFVSSVRSRLGRMEKLRNRVFLGATGFWLLLTVLLLPLQFFPDSLQKMSALGAELDEWLQKLAELDVVALADQPNTLAIAVIFALCAYALASVQLRGW
jgi:hypothetical protein